MIFIESPVFTEDVKKLLTDAEYAALQLYLVYRPRVGDVIRGTGGLRKVRWMTEGRGKRGGTRVISPPRRRPADSHDPDLSQGHQGRSDAGREGAAAPVERGMGR